jgi:hypothetical protein
MAEDHGPSVKDDRLYEKLRDEGESKEKAARIANAKAGGTDVSENGGWAESYEDRTREELEARAVKRLIQGWVLKRAFDWWQTRRARRH